MRVYQIDYDLRKQRNYDALIQRIKDYGTYCRPLQSSWLVVSSRSATEIRDSLKAVMDNDDGLLVTQLTGVAAWTGLSTDASKWLKEQLERCAV